MSPEEVSFIHLMSIFEATLCISHSSPTLRLRRIVPWGMPMSINGLPYLKGIGIRIHTVRYQKVRKRIINDDIDSSDHNDEDDITKRERRRIRSTFFLDEGCCV